MTRQSIICSECGTPLHDINEPCPNCCPSIAWRAPTRGPCPDCARLRAKVATLEQKIRKLSDEAHLLKLYKEK